MRRPLVLVCASALLATGCVAPEQTAYYGADHGLEPGDLRRAEVPLTDVGDAREPEPLRCSPLSESPDGSYTVADAGTATVALEGEELVVGPIEAATGWEHEVLQEDPDQVQILFTGDDEELTLVVSSSVDLREDIQVVQPEICTGAPAE